MWNIRSFSEAAFLNPTYLRYLNPTECEEQKVNRPHASVMETIQNLEFNPYASNQKGSKHRLTKPLRSVARMVYTISVALFAILGIIYHAGSALKNLTFYAYNKSTNNVLYNRDLSIAKRHAICMLTDLCTTTQGVVTAGLFVMVGTFMFSQVCALGLTFEAFQIVIGGTFAGSLFTYLLGGFDPQTFIPNLVGDSENRIGMYLSLRLRNDLGLVKADGGLLPFNQADQIYSRQDSGYKPNTYTISFTEKDKVTPSETFKKLNDFIANSELDLLDQVLDANKFLGENNLEKIVFTHPFNGNTIAKTLQKQFDQLKGSVNKPQAKLQKLINEFQLSQRKIDALQRTISDVCEISVNRGFIGFILRSLTDQGAYSYTKQKSYVEHTYCAEYFSRHSCEPDINYDLSPEISTVFRNAQVPAINPNDVKYNPDDSTYNKFKYKVGVEKYRVMHHIKQAPLHELLFLKETHNFENITSQYRHLSLQIHPDRNSDSQEESKELFSVLGEVKKQLEKDINVKKL